MVTRSYRALGLCAEGGPMNKSFKTLVTWLLAHRGRLPPARRKPTTPVPEHARRLEELERSGRVLLLP